MPSRKRPTGAATAPQISAPFQRIQLNLGAFTANTTVTPAPRILWDRRAVIREVWFSASAIPSDPDGTMLINMINFDINESTGTDDTLVSSFDAEAVLLVANKAYQATLVTETTENELTVEPGDVTRFTLVDNSAAITTNPNITALVIFQTVSK
jgi:hypothetical protein